ncbi:acyl carrier protein [Clostridium sp. DL1XJH146]
MIFEKVKEMISEQLGTDIDDITEASALIEDLDADSLDIVELIMAVEDEYEIEISEEVAEKMSTVGDVVEYIKENIEE